jgi:hypothetical protein
VKPVNKDIIEYLVDKFINTVSSGEFKQCALLFWKAHEIKYKAIASIARRFLSVPASSAAVERILSISGHILSTKRTKMSIKLFTNMAFLFIWEVFLFEISSKHNLYLFLSLNGNVFING